MTLVRGYLSVGFFTFEKPSKIAKNASPKDLHCKDKRYKQAIELNNLLLAGEGNFIQARERYSGVMYNAIDYLGMSEVGKDYFDANFLIVSGMYGLLAPADIIGDYKLPIAAKGLYKFWGDRLTQTLQNLSPDMVVNLLPQAYSKLIGFDDLSSQIIDIGFMTYKNDELVHMAHGVKKVKGEWIKNICENTLDDYTQFGGEVTDSSSHKITIQIIHT